MALDPKECWPGSVELKKLEDWSKRPEEGIRDYSGTAIYQTVFTCPQTSAGWPPTFSTR